MTLTLSAREEKLITEIERLPQRDLHGTAGMILSEKAQEFQNLYSDMLNTRSSASGSYKEQANKMNTLWNWTSSERGSLVMDCQGDCPLKSLVKVICLELQNNEGMRGLSLLWSCIENAQEDQALLDISKLSEGRSKLLESFSKYIGVEKVWARVMWPNSVPPRRLPPLQSSTSSLRSSQTSDATCSTATSATSASIPPPSNSSIPAISLAPSAFSNESLGPKDGVPSSCMGELRQRK
jgi:hypothetical protein